MDEDRKAESLKALQPFITSGIVYCLAMTIIAIQSNMFHPGIFAYATDDAYIHTALAKNLAQHGVWGVTSHGFTSASSSPGWTVVLTLFATIVSLDYVPFALNIAFSLATLFVAHKLLKLFLVARGIEFVTLLIIAVGSSLAVVSWVGLEHTAHCFSSLTVLYFFVLLIQKQPTAFAVPWGLAISLALNSSLRYEGIVLAFSICLILVFQKKWNLAFLCGISAWIAPISFGLFAMSHGWHFFPSSVLIRADLAQYFHLVPTADIAVAGVGINLGSVSELYNKSGNLLPVFCALIALYWVVRHRLDRVITVFFIAVAMTAFFSLPLVKTMHWERYLVYLWVMLLVVSSVLLQRIVGSGNLSTLKRLTVGTLTGLIALLALQRTIQMYSEIPVGTQNIAYQQIRMGEFVTKFYPTSSIALNDIGYVCYRNDIRLTDLAGLAELNQKEILASLSEKTSKLSRERDIAIAICYPSWYRTTLPRHWRKVGEWKIENNVICGGDTVAFFAVKSGTDSLLRANLMQFDSTLPQSERKLHRVL